MCPVVFLYCLNKNINNHHLPLNTEYIFYPQRAVHPSVLFHLCSDATRDIKPLSHKKPPLVLYFV